jgi:histidinol phosphatase-like PHP family hydrolase
MTWRPVDCHAHSLFSDGALSVEQVADRVRSLGVVPSLADHISRDVSHSVRDLDGVRAYLDALDACPVLRGGEFCWHDSLWRELPADLVQRFTHRLGSLHAIRLADDTLVRAFARRLPRPMSVREYMAGHLASLERLAREMPVDILSHPTLVALPFRATEPTELWTETHETRMIDALHAANIAFELSTRYPSHERIVRCAIERGVRLSLGSDGHTLTQVGDVRRPLALARSFGVRDEDLYDPVRHGSKTHAGQAVLA